MPSAKWRTEYLEGGFDEFTSRKALDEWVEAMRSSRRRRAPGHAKSLTVLSRSGAGWCQVYAINLDEEN